MSDPVYKPMRGWGTGAGDGPPILDPYGSPNPVVMLSPCPYSSGDYEMSEGGLVGDFTRSGLTYRVTATTSAPYAAFTARFVFAGVQRMKITISTSLESELSQGSTAGGGISGLSSFYFVGPSPGWYSNEFEFDVPYYRWAFVVSMYCARIVTPQYVAGDWVQVTFSDVAS